MTRTFAAFHLLEDVARAVRAAIVDDDDFLGNGHGLDAPHHLAEPALLVVNGNHHRQLETVRDGVNAELPAGRLAEQVMQQRQAFLGRTRELPRKRVGDLVGGMAIT